MGCNLLELLTLVVFFKVCNSSFHIFLSHIGFSKTNQKSCLYLLKNVGYGGFLSAHL